MIVVFWLRNDGAGEAHPKYRVFASHQLTAALAFAQELRDQRARGEPISHVTLQSEMPEAVGQAGVKDPDPGYSHYKRRLDPSIQLGRERPGSAPAPRPGDEAAGAPSPPRSL